MTSKTRKARRVTLGALNWAVWLDAEANEPMSDEFVDWVYNLLNDEPSDLRASSTLTAHAPTPTPIASRV